MAGDARTAPASRVLPQHVTHADRDLVSARQPKHGVARNTRPTCKAGFCTNGTARVARTASASRMLLPSRDPRRLRPDLGQATDRVRHLMAVVSPSTIQQRRRSPLSPSSTSPHHHHLSAHQMGPDFVRGGWGFVPPKVRMMAASNSECSSSAQCAHTHSDPFLLSPCCGAHNISSADDSYFPKRELGGSVLLTFSASERVSPTTIPSHMSSSRPRIQA